MKSGLFKRTDPIRFKKRGDTITCEGYTIEPFHKRLIVYNDKTPFCFFDNLIDAKKWVRRQLRAKFINDAISSSILNQANYFVKYFNSKNS